MVILNNHISDAKWCCSETDGNGMWYNPDYPAEKWFDALKNMTLRYKHNPMVIGNDLRNELRADKNNNVAPTWGTGDPATDWRLAAIKGGNLVLENNPNLLIFVEGINYDNDISGMKNHPVKLNVDNKLVIEWHFYSW